jgi:Fe-Mn family superoxide dismutase
MYTLPKLPYDYSTLEPAIDKQTMEIHHTKHHQAYVDKLNATGIEGDLDKILSGLDKVPEAVRQAVRNNGGGHWNHSLFWEMMSPQGGEPSSKLKQALEKEFGGVEEFKTKFSEAAISRFGSGWVWLVAKDGKLMIGSTPNQDSPLMVGVSEFTGTPLLALDVWEHAYYILYRWERAKYVAAWWSVVNWNEVSRLFAAVVK